ncbi:MAG: hydrogenase maturation nickel metallochaperone HypA [Actinobacteria bacterium]|nr:hydrogenase maturation nickel metallochaperone HypA [Actinomycetota bacterium]
MHELSVWQAIVDTVASHAGDRRVRRVTVRIGHLRQVVPDALTFAWDVLTEGTSLAGAALVVQHVPAVVECAACGARTTLELPVLVCGDCGALDVRLCTGEEFLLESLDVVEEVS